MKLAKRVEGISPSLTLSITAKAKALSREGKKIINFAAGEPDFDTPDYIKNAATQAIKEGFTKYTPNAGIQELREAICAKFKRDNGLSYSPSQVIVSCGAKHSLYNIFQVICEEGDEVILPSPYWLSYPEMIKLAGAEPVIANTTQEDGFKLTKNELKKNITNRTKAIVINSPSNPTGAVYNLEELKMVADLASANNIIVISDEIYESLIYDGAKHISIASLSSRMYELTLAVNGVSKSHSMTGWRIGYAAGNMDIINAIDNLQSHSTSNPTSISQKAALEALRGSRDSVAQMAMEFEARRNFMVQRISQIKKLGYFKPGGAFYLFCDISKTGLGSLEFSEKLLLEAHVAIVPGIVFGSDSHVRLSFATSMDAIKEGIERIQGWLEKR